MSTEYLIPCLVSANLLFPILLSLHEMTLSPKGISQLSKVDFNRIGYSGDLVQSQFSYQDDSIN